MLRVIVEAGLVDREFVAACTTGFDAVVAAADAWDLERTANTTGVPPQAIERAARWVGEAGARRPPPRARHRAPEQGRRQRALGDQPGARHRQRRPPGCGATMITGQGNGQGGREHGQKCDQLPGQRSIEDPAARAHVAKVWGVDESEIPHAGLSAQEIMNAIHAGEIKGLVCICFNPLVSLPDARFTREALEKLELFCVIDFFLSETAHLADVVLAGSLQEEEEGLTCNVEGRVIHIRQAVPPPKDARADSWILCELGRRLGRPELFPFQHPREILAELREASRGGIADYAGISYEKIDRQMGVFWPCPSDDHPGTPRLFADGRFFHADGKAHFVVPEYRPSGDPVDDEFPVYLTTGRVVSQYLSGTRRGASARCSTSSPPARRDPPAPRQGARHRRRRLGHRHHPAQRRDPAGAVVSTIRPTPCSSPTTGRRAAAPTASPPHPRPAQQDPRVQGLCLQRAARGGPAGMGGQGGRRRGAGAGVASTARAARGGHVAATTGTHARRRLLHRPLALHRLPGLRQRLRRVRHPPRRGR
jgi:predicted molibdopterin-dependent oxidoreductase YjgC